MRGTTTNCFSEAVEDAVVIWCFLFDLVRPLQGQGGNRQAGFTRKNGAALDGHFGQCAEGGRLAKNHPTKHGVTTARGVEAGVVDQVDENLVDAESSAVLRAMATVYCVFDKPVVATGSSGMLA